MNELHSRIDAYGAKYAVSFHFNAASSRARGHEVLYWSRSREGERVARLFDNAFDKYLSNRDRNLLSIDKGRGGGFLRKGSSVNVLLEPYFAAHQAGFVKGTMGYDNLMKAVVEVMAKIAGVSSSQDNSAPVTHDDNIDMPSDNGEYNSGYIIGKKSRKNLEAVGNPLLTKVAQKAIKLTKQDFSILEGGKFVPYRPTDSTASQQILDAVIDAIKKS